MSQQLRIQSQIVEQKDSIKGRKINNDQVDLKQDKRRTNYSLNFETHIPSSNQLFYLNAIISQQNESDMAASGRESEQYPKEIYKNKLNSTDVVRITQKPKKKRKKAPKAKKQMVSQKQLTSEGVSKKQQTEDAIKHGRLTSSEAAFQYNIEDAFHSNMFNREAAIRKSQQIYATQTDTNWHKKKKSRKSKSNSNSKSKSKSKSNSKSHSKSQQKTKTFSSVDPFKLSKQTLKKGDRSVSAERLRKVNKTDSNEPTVQKNKPGKNYSNENMYKSPQMSVNLQKSKVSSNNKGSAPSKQLLELSTFFNDKSKYQQPKTISLQQRRKELGLDFLNGLQEKKIDSLLERNRLNSIIQEEIQNNSDRKRPVFTPKQALELQRYMKEKKKFYKTVDQLRQVRQIVKKQQINCNLEKLEKEVKQKSASNSRSPQRTSQQKESSQKTKKSSNNMTLSNSKQKSLFGSKNSQNYKDMLHDQFNRLSKRFSNMQQKMNYQLSDENELPIKIEPLNSPSLAHLISHSSSNNLLSVRESNKNSGRREVRIKHHFSENEPKQHKKELEIQDLRPPDVESEPQLQSQYASQMDDRQHMQSQSNRDHASLNSSIQQIDNRDHEPYFRYPNSRDNSLHGRLSAKNLNKDSRENVHEKQIKSQKIDSSRTSSQGEVKPLLAQEIYKENIKESPIEQAPKEDFYSQAQQTPQQQQSQQSQQQISNPAEIASNKSNKSSDEQRRPPRLFRDEKAPNASRSLEYLKIMSDESRGSAPQSNDSKSGRNIPDYMIQNEAWPIFAEKIQSMSLQGRLSPQNVIKLNELNFKKQQVQGYINYEDNIAHQENVKNTEGSMQAQASQPSQLENYYSGSNKDNQSFNSFIHAIEEAPLDLDNQFGAKIPQNDEIQENLVIIDNLIRFDDEPQKIVSEAPVMPAQRQEVSGEASPIQNLQIVKTNLVAVRDYIEDIIGTIFELFEQKFLMLLNTPIGPSAFEILKFFRFTDEMCMEDGSIEGGFQHQAVLGLECFAMREKRVEERNPEKNQNEFMCELDRIHNKAIFDAFNESLDYFRPFGIKGRPLPWKKCVKLVTKRINQSDMQQVLQSAKLKVLGWAEMLCGIFIPNLPIGQMSQFHLIDAEILPQIREDRLDKMLSLDIQETDDRWQEYEEEQTEIELELSEVVFEMLINECAEELDKFGLKKQKGIRMIQKQDLNFLQEISQLKNPYI